MDCCLATACTASGHDKRQQILFVVSWLARLKLALYMCVGFLFVCLLVCSVDVVMPACSGGIAQAVEYV